MSSSSCHLVILSSVGVEHMSELPLVLGEITTYTHDSRSLTIDCGGPRIQMTVLTPTLIRVRLAPDGAFAPRRSWAVARADEEFAEVACEVRASAETIELDTGALAVRVERASGRISFVDKHGRPFCADADGARWGDAA